MIVVLSVLGAVAVPRYFDFRERAQVAATASSLKVIRGVFLQYWMNTGTLPPDGVTGSDVPELLPYLQDPKWATPIASLGRLNWDGPPGHTGSEAIALTPNVTPSDPTNDPFWIRIDQTLDDGNLNTGNFGWSSANRYKFWLWPPSFR